MKASKTTISASKSKVYASSDFFLNSQGIYLMSYTQKYIYQLTEGEYYVFNTNYPYTSIKQETSSSHTMSSVSFSVSSTTTTTVSDNTSTYFTGATPARLSYSSGSLNMSGLVKQRVKVKYTLYSPSSNPFDTSITTTKGITKLYRHSTSSNNGYVVTTETGTFDLNSSGWNHKFYEITFQDAPSSTQVGTVTSENLADYPENGIQDGYWYILRT